LEGEYIVANHCTRKEILLQQLLVGMKCKQEGSTIIICDN
jgi:hypothetical protein